MSKHRHRIEEDELPVIALDWNKNKAKDTGFQTKGWKFYISIRELLPEWWHEFNGETTSSKQHRNFRSRYKDTAQFIKGKIKDKQQREWFVWMTGPKRVWEREAISEKRYLVPWLGDWKARRRNGYWETENKEQIRYLSKAIKENVSSSQAIRATSPFIVQSLMRWVRLQDKIDQLFNGEPFVDEEPHSKNNYRRFKLYTSMHEQVEELKTKTIKEWMRIHGVDPNNPHEMADMATMAQLVGQSAAASALTGYTAGSMQPMIGQDGKPNGSQELNLNNQGITISPDALLLAQHLVKHSQTFRKPLPAIEGEVIEEKNKEKANGHSRTN